MSLALRPSMGKVSGLGLDKRTDSSNLISEMHIYPSMSSE